MMRLLIGNQQENYFHINTIASYNYALSKHYQFNIELKYFSNVCKESFLQKHAVLTENDMCIHGVITKVEVDGRGDFNNITLMLESPLVNLSRIKKTKVYHNCDAVSIAKSIFCAYPLTQVKYQFDIKYNLFLHKQLVQHEESDYDFLTKVLNWNGCFFYFIQETNYVLLVVSDNYTYFRKRHMLPYQKLDGLLLSKNIAYSITHTLRLQSQCILSKKHYAYQQDPISIAKHENNTNYTGHGCVYYYGGCFANLTQQKQWVKAKMRAIENKRQQLIIKTNCVTIQPGEIVTIKGHPCKSFNISYRVISLKYDSELVEDNSSVIVTVLLSVIPLSDEVFIDSIISVDPGYIEAQVVENNNNSILDNEGCYSIRMDKMTISSVPLLQFYSGPHTGAHFPLRKDTKVLIAFMDGDVNRPVIIGPVVTDMNSSVLGKNSWQSNEGNQLLINDSTPSLKINTKNQRQIFHLGYGNDRNNILLQSNDSSLNCVSAGNLSQMVKKNYVLTSKQSCSMQTENFQVFTEQGNVSIQAGENLLLNSNRKININSQKHNVAFVCDKDYFVYNENNCHILAAESIQYVMKNSALDVSSHKDIIFDTKKDLVLQQGEAMIKITQQGDINIEANEIVFIGKTISLVGLRTSVC